MFEEITIKPSDNLNYDLGRIAESLLFYQKVNLVCSPSFFHRLVLTADFPIFLELMKSGQIHVKLENNVFGMMNNTIGKEEIPWQRPILIKGKNVSIQDRLERTIFEQTQKKGFTRRTVKKILDNSEVFYHDAQVIQFVEDDLNDPVFLKRAIAYTIEDYNPEMIVPPETIETQVEKIQDGFVIHTNLDFEAISEESDSEFPISVQNALSNIMTSRADSTLASQFNSDIVTRPLITTIMQEKVSDLMIKSGHNEEQIEAFIEMVLPEGRTIRDVMAEGERSLKEFVEILEKANKFKEWLAKLESENDLLVEYHNEVVTDTWVDKLPGKSFRWSFFTGLGLLIDAAGAGGLGTAAGLTLSAGDTFLLDKLIKGWKPNTFIDGDLKDFIENEDEE